MEIFDELEYMLIEKEKNISDSKGEEMVKTIKEMLNNKVSFFMVDMETVVGILYFLGVKRENLQKTYLKVVSIENYNKIFPKQRLGISNDI